MTINPRKQCYLFVIALTVLLFAFTACDRNHISVDVADSNFEIKNGMLWFTSEQKLVNQMDKLSVLSDEQLVDWLYAQGFTNSLLLSYYGNENEPEHLLNCVSMSRHYAALLSVDGFLAAADTLVQLTPDTEFVFFDADTSTLKSVKTNKQSNNRYIANPLTESASAGTTVIHGQPNSFFWPEQGETRTLFSHLDASILWWNKHFSITFYHNYKGKIDITWLFEYQIRERNGSNKCESVSYYGMEENRTFYNVNEMVIVAYEFWHDGRGGCFCWKDAKSDFVFTKDNLVLGSGGIQQYKDDCRK